MAGGTESRSYTGEMPDPTITAAREIVEESIEGNVMHSTRSWLAVATGAPLPDRDRDAEFRTVVADARDLLETVERLAADCSALLTTEDAFEPGTMRESHSRASSGRAEIVSGAWALLHAVEHLREHMGHAQLTRRLWDQREG